MQFPHKLDNGKASSDQKLKSCTSIGGNITLPNIMAPLGHHTIV